VNSISVRSITERQTERASKASVVVQGSSADESDSSPIPLAFDLIRAISR